MQDTEKIWIYPATHHHLPEEDRLALGSRDEIELRKMLRQAEQTGRSGKGSYMSREEWERKKGK